MSPKTIDFIGIGTAKSASTWVFRCLSEHPEVCASRRKEMRFFDNPHNFKKGLKWYFSFFPEPQPGQITGEFSPSYIYSRETAQRIRDTFPHVKLIAVFRNPVDKIYSSFWSNKTGGRGSLVMFNTIEDAIREIDGMLDPALHGRQLQEYLNIFPKEQIYTIIYDDIRENPERAMQGVYQFLGIDDSFVAPSTHRSVNETGDKRIKYPLLFTIIYSAYWKIRKFSWIRKLIKSMNGTGVSVALSRFGTERGGEKVIKPAMNPETRRRLKDFYTEDVLLLERLIGRDLSAWK